MKHPLWILNSAITTLLIGAFLFMLLSRQSKPPREEIEPEVSSDRIKQDEIRINLTKIYENDLFDTYQKETPRPIAQTVNIPLPQPPTPEIARVPEMPKPEFLDPLNITLKGIIVISSNENKNRAVIQDNQTKREQTYKVGNTIGDAQLIRIFSNKVIFLRSNGQQEVLYLREKDAEMDPAYAALSGWDNVIQSIDDTHRTVNPRTFTDRVQNLAQFIDMLDITTAFAKGKSIGCRIGQTKNKSLGRALGFMTGDIVLSVDNIPATNTQERFQIYKNILNKQTNEPITVKLLRAGQPLTLVYALEDFSIIDKLEAVHPAEELSLTEQQQRKQLLEMQQKNTFAPTVRDLRKRERQNMLNRGKMPTGYKPMQNAE